MQKRKFSTELAYVIGLILLAASVACVERANLGISMVSAPSYLLHLKLSQFSSFFTFGTTDYLFQALLIATMALLIRKIRLYYLFSFITALLSGKTLDGLMALLRLVPMDTLYMRALFFALGIALCAVGVSLFFHSYIAPGAYELVVKELSAHFHLDINRFKLCFDLGCCALALALSLLFFGRIQGIGAGTVISALVNGPLIGCCSRWLDKRFLFVDALPLHLYFQA